MTDITATAHPLSAEGIALMSARPRPALELVPGIKPAVVHDMVRLGPFSLADATRARIVDGLVEAHEARRSHVAFALHVGGIVKRREASYVEAMQRANLVYADGISVVLLGRLAGARQLERAATTDIGEDLLQRIAPLGGSRPLRIALVGGPEGLAAGAASALSERYHLDVVLAEHGYHADWSDVRRRIVDADAELVLVGMGAPREMTWVHESRESLSGRLVVTCGGWFGFLVGEESRAPRLLQRVGLEWVWRLAQQPRRLAKRYLLGAVVCTLVLMSVVFQRLLWGRLVESGAPR